MTKQIAFIDLKTQQKRIRSDLEGAINTVLDHGMYVMGPEIAELETKLAEYTGAKYALSCSSGTDALVLPLMVWELQKNDAVFVPSFTFVATAEAVVLAGGTPVFVDVRKDTFNLDVNSLKQAIVQAKKNGLNPRGIISVDLFGQPADYEQIEAIAKEENLFLLDDACQGFGGQYKGKKVGSIGDMTATSFFPAKPLGCYGDGGAIFTDNEEWLEKLKSIRVHGGGSNKYDNVRIGVNARCDTIQAAVLLQKLKIFDDELSKRDDVAKHYNQGLSDVVTVPYLINGVSSAWAQYTVLVNNREELVTYLSEHNIPTACYYPIPLHKQTGYLEYHEDGIEMPVSNDLADKVLSLPMHPYLDKETQNYIIDAIVSFYRK